MFTILLLGNTNVGKTSIFNMLTKTNLAINNKINNFTYDFNYGILKFKSKYFICVDTFGLSDFKFLKIFYKNKFFLENNNIQMKFIYTMKNVDLICLLVDYISGFNNNDILLSKFVLKNLKKKIVLLINKVDLCKDYYYDLHRFYSLGINLIYPISIFYKKSILYFLNDIFFKKKIFKEKNNFFYKKIIHFCINLDKYNFLLKKKNNDCIFTKFNYIKVVILGKPNVGKSTFMNFIVKNNRSIVSSNYGTTKDFITCFININNVDYIISDSPGLDKLTKNFYINSKSFNKKIFLNKILDFKIIFYLIDINIGITKYDLFLLNLFFNCGKIVVLFFNKCESFSKFEINQYRKSILLKYDFTKNMDIYFISAINLKENIINFLFKNLINNYKNIFLNKINSCRLTRFLKQSLDIFYDNNIKNLVKLKYAHIGGYYPFTIVIHGNKINLLNHSYKKYLINFYTKILKFKGYKIFLKFKEIINPYIKK